MFMTAKLNARWLLTVLSGAAVILMVTLIIPGQTAAQTVAKVVHTTPAAEAPAYAGYKGIKIGAAMNDVRTKLGKARDTSDTEDYFVISDNESVQVLYDPDKTVRVISINYVGTKTGVPTPKEVFGEDAEAKPDGSIYKMVKYPKAGYWIMYNKTSGDDPLIMITLQKMAPGQ
jgi:hypothetical protein